MGDPAYSLGLVTTETFVGCLGGHPAGVFEISGGARVRFAGKRSNMDA
jgi:hypothetical protein